MRYRMNKFGMLILMFFLFVGKNIYAQDNVIDEVVWVVGDEAILKSEVEEERLRAQYEGHKLDGDPYCVNSWLFRNCFYIRRPLIVLKFPNQKYCNRWSIQLIAISSL